MPKTHQRESEGLDFHYENLTHHLFNTNCRYDNYSIVYSWAVYKGNGQIWHSVSSSDRYNTYGIRNCADINFTDDGIPYCPKHEVKMPNYMYFFCRLRRIL